MAKRKNTPVESVPAQKTCCRFKSMGQELTGEILVDKGLGYQVLTGEDDTPTEERVSMFVHKKHVLGTWNEGEPGAPEPEPIPVEPLDPTSLAGQAALLAAQESKKADLPPKVDGQKMVQLKQLCPEGLETRIARRRLRKALGNVGTGSRWEWPEGSTEIENIRAILALKPAASPVPATEPADPDLDLAQDLVTPIEEIEETGDEPTDEPTE